MADTLIIGSGAVGVVIGAQLERLGLKTVFASHGTTSERVVTIQTGTHTQTMRLEAATPKALAQVRLVIIAVKAFSLAAALQETLANLEPAIPSEAVVMPVGNGAVQSIVRSAAKTMPRLVWRLGFCTFGVTRDGVEKYQLRSVSGRVFWGALAPDLSTLRPIETLLSRDKFFEHVDAIEPVFCRKWLFNTVLNTMTAVYRMPRNIDVLAKEAELRAVFAEALKLGAIRFGSWQASEAELYNALLALIADTAENENSMARDRRLGQPTETAFMAGLAASAPTDFPRLSALNGILTSQA